MEVTNLHLLCAFLLSSPSPTPSCTSGNLSCALLSTLTWVYKFLTIFPKKNHLRPERDFCDPRGKLRFIWAGLLGLHGPETGMERDGIDFGCLCPFGSIHSFPGGWRQGPRAQRMVLRPAASPSPGSLLGMQSPRPLRRPWGSNSAF